MALLLGLLVAAAYGLGDFSGGLAARRAATTAVVWWSFVVATACVLGVLAAWALLGGLPHPTAHVMLIGLAVGCLSPVGIALLYRGLALGPMGVVSPVAAVVGAVVPVAWGLARGERPPALGLAGVAVALVAVVLISGAGGVDPDGPSGHPPIRRVLPIAMGAGVAFGGVFVLLGSAGSRAGVWPIVVARPLSVVLLGVIVLLRAPRGAVGARPAAFAVRRDAWALVAGAGVLDITANVLYLDATRRGLLAIVAVVASLYPAGTVAMARVVLGERVHRTQVVGLVLAGCGVAAMAVAR